jgi:hypothetical protein
MAKLKFLRINLGQNWDILFKIEIFRCNTKNFI